MIGQILDGRYRVLSQLGRGAMGEVYLAEHLHLGRREALKVLHPSLASDPQFVSRFRREARATNRLSHPNIVSVHDFGQLPDGRFYLAMEYAEGESLSRVLATVGRLPLVRALYLLHQLAAAVDHAHQRGVVHRDLKPDNLVLVQKRGRTDLLKVLDFGIAKIVAPDYQESLGVTPKGEVFGTPAYMAPEQFRGEGVDPRCDLYSVGCIAYEIITGALPFVGRKMELMHAHATRVPTAPSVRAPEAGLPAELDALVLRCLEKQPLRRFPTGADLQLAIENVPGFDLTHSSSARRRALIDFDVPDTLERRFVEAAPEGPDARAQTERIPPEELERALDELVRRVAEALIDAGHNDLQLVIGLASVHQLDDDLRSNEAESGAIAQRVTEVEQSAREREGALRFSLGELHFERARALAGGEPVDPSMSGQIVAFEQRLTHVVAELSRQKDALIDRSVALAAARANLEERRASLLRSLERLVQSLLPQIRLPTLAPLANQMQALRDALERLGTRP
jgi:serine/threonine protein kinase